MNYNKNSLIYVGLAFLVSVSTIFFFIGLKYKPCCDAIHYYTIASNIGVQGLENSSSHIRTFAYPWVLSLVIGVGKAINLPGFFVIFAAQLAVYVAVLFHVKRSFAVESEKLAAFVFFVLCLNIYLLPYLSTTLTDALYTCLCLTVLINLINIERSAFLTGSVSTTYIALTMFSVCFAIVIRPASIWLVFPLCYVFFLLIWRKQISLSGLLVSLSLACIPLYIQMALNLLSFNKLTFFPVTDLGSLQVRWGIENIKYATWLGGGAMQNFYPTTNLILATDNFSISWYYLHPADAIKLLTVKFIGAFDFDFIMPYPYRTEPAWIASAISFTIFWFGLFGSLLHAFTNRLTHLGSRYMPVVIIGSWASVSLVSALELRFTLPLLTYFMVVAVYTVNKITIIENRKYLMVAMVGWIVVMPMLFYVASFVRAQSAILRLH